MHKSFKIASVTFAAAAVLATSACAAGSYATPGSPSGSAKPSHSAKAVPANSAAASAKPSTAKSTSAKAATPSQVLASTAWETTGAKNEKGTKVALTDAAVKNYVGNAYYNEDGTFTMYTLDDKQKMKGEWTVSADGKTRTLNVKDKDGKVTKRVVEIVKLTEKEFTYRVYPEASDKTKYYDIVHTPTKHAEPRA